MAINFNKLSCLIFVILSIMFLSYASFAATSELEDITHETKLLHQCRLQEQFCEADKSEELHQGSDDCTLDVEDVNPYLFKKEGFGPQLETPLGNIRVVERFDKRSKLLTGIENYRIIFVEINPNTFMVPAYWDADSVNVMLNGHGSVTLIQNPHGNEIHEVKAGDIVRFGPATPMYFMNTQKEKFYVASLALPINVPGQYKSFYASGEGSYFNAFSDRMLQAAFNETDIGELRKFFQGGNDGPFATASPEQIKALTEGSSETRDKQATYPYNLFDKHPSESNKYGELFEVSTTEYKLLQDIDVQVSYTNITRGGMMAPHFNTKSTKIAIVVKGNGDVEMACPHLSHIQRLSAKVRAGDVFIVPAGHPIIIAASNDQNLELLYFEVNGESNQRVPLSGKNSVLKHMKDEAKKLSFNFDAKRVDEVLNKQKESWFLPGPIQQSQQHCASK